MRWGIKCLARTIRRLPLGTGVSRGPAPRVAWRRPRPTAAPFQSAPRRARQSSWRSGWMGPHSLTSTSACARVRQRRMAPLRAHWPRTRPRSGGGGPAQPLEPGILVSTHGLLGHHGARYTNSGPPRGERRSHLACRDHHSSRASTGPPADREALRSDGRQRRMLVYVAASAWARVPQAAGRNEPREFSRGATRRPDPRGARLRGTRAGGMVLVRASRFVPAHQREAGARERLRCGTPTTSS